MAIDTSALLAIAFGEAQREACITAMELDADVIISAGTLTEALIVSALRGFGDNVASVVRDLRMEVIPITEASARRAAVAYERWGKGIHPAGLNFGDCFAYEVATDRHCPLLFVGNDFARTDIKSVL